MTENVIATMPNIECVNPALLLVDIHFQPSCERITNKAIIEITGTQAMTGL